MESSEYTSYNSLQPPRAEVKTEMDPRNSRVHPQGSHDVVQKRRFSGQGGQAADSWVDILWAMLRQEER